jgi:hypothetical protein
MSKTNRKLKKGIFPAEAAKAEPAKTLVTSACSVAPPVATSMPVAAPTPKREPAPPPTPPPPAPNKVSLTLVKPEASQVCVAGSFNEWKPERTPLSRVDDGRWVGSLTVPPGRHEYLFVVDGQWVPDPNAAETVANPFGGKNSVLVASE